MTGFWTKASIVRFPKKGAALTGAIAASWLILQGILGLPALAKAKDNTFRYRPECLSKDALEVVEKEATLSYSQLLNCFKEREITKANIDPSRRIAKVQLSGQKNEKIFQTTRLFKESPELYKLLKDKELTQNIKLAVNRSADNAAALGLAANLLIVLLLVAGLMIVLRRSTNASNQAMSFGKSRARFQMEAKTGIMFDDVAGIEEAKEELQEVVTFLKKPERFTAVGARIPKGVLLIGAPGTGKTLLARAISGEAGVPFFSISGSEFVEMFVGVGASRVRDLFRKAKENAPCIVFIDEIDAVGRQRGTGIGGGNDEREQTLNQLLTEMDGFEGNTGIIIIAATNRPDVLDSALLRPGRFDRQISIDYPDVRGRLAILEVHARNKKLDPDVSLDVISRRTPGLTGADLANLLNEAAILTARRRKESIAMPEINDAVDRVVAGMEGHPLVDSKKKRMTAYHEMGHALVATLLKHHDPLQKVTLIPRGRAVGLTWYTPDEEHGLMSRSQLLAKITSTLGGLAAEDAIFGDAEVTTGAADDLKTITSLARQMVTRFGMSDLGPLSLDGQMGDVFLGRNLVGHSEYSDEITSHVDRQVRAMIKHCYEDAKRIIQENRVLMDRLVDILLDQETIEGDEFRKLVEDYRQQPVHATASVG